MPHYGQRREDFWVHKFSLDDSLASGERPRTDGELPVRFVDGEDVARGGVRGLVCGFEVVVRHEVVARVYELQGGRNT